MSDEYFTIVIEPAAAGIDGVITRTVRLSGEFDLGARDDLQSAVMKAVRDGGAARAVIDLTQVDLIDSKTVQVLLEGYTQAQQRGMDYRLAHARGVVQRVLEVLGLARLIGMHPTRPTGG